MTEHKYILTDLDLWSTKYVNWNGERIKTANIIDFLDQFLAKNITYGRDWIRLNSRVLKWLYGSQYTHIISYLENKNILYLWKNYSVGIKAKCYRLTKEAKEMKIVNVAVEIPDRLSIKRLKMRNQTIDIDDVIKEKLIKDLFRVEIDKNAAIDWCDTNLEKNSMPYLSNIMSITKISSGQIYYSFDKYGRFHTNFTNLKKEIRNQFLSINKNKTAEIDIANSQPFFMWLLMKDSGYGDLDNFKYDVLNGIIYNKVAEMMNCTRKEAKVKVYAVMFGRNIGSEWDLCFKKLYPNVYNWILNFKTECKSYKSLAQKLQKTESDFIFGYVIPKIIEWKNVSIITIHDSIVFEDIYKDKIEEIFENCKKQIIKDKFSVLV